MLGIKLKNFKKISSWMAFILGISLIFVTLTMVFDYARLNQQDRKHKNEMITLDLKERAAFKSTMVELFNHLLDSNDSTLRKNSIRALDNEGENLLYYMYNAGTKIETSNMERTPVIRNDIVYLPDGFDYYIYFDGSSYRGLYKGEPIEFKHDSSKRTRVHLRHDFSENTYYYNPYTQTSYRMLLAVNENITKQTGNSLLYNLNQEDTIFKINFAMKLLIPFAGIVLLVLAIIDRKNPRNINEKITSKISLFRLEYKILLLLAPALVFDILSIAYEIPLIRISQLIMLALTGWWLFYIILDLTKNKEDFIRNSNIINISKSFDEKFKHKPLPRVVQYKLVFFVCLNISLILVTAIFYLGLYSLFSNYGPILSLALLFLVFLSATISLIIMSVRAFNDFVDNLCILDNHLLGIKDGDFRTKLESRDYKTLYQLAEDLRHIQDGMSATLENMLKSERTKVELITNISHDLKTPLTSIISYIDLLLKDEELPEHARDYVKVLQMKSERLKLLIQDLFDLSKAASGEMKLNIKTLDLSRLVTQIIADTNDRISTSSLDYKISKPESAVYIDGDSEKLYRVFMNLIQNTLKFSLDGTRVYIDVIDSANYACVEIRNIANYEMNFNENDILDRFVKGDLSRATEGSGLGLAIAQSFTQILGGSLKVSVDGDLFKAIIKLPKPTVLMGTNDELSSLDDNTSD